MSWTGLALVLASGLAGLAALATVLERRLDAAAVEDVRSRGQLIAELVTAGTVPSEAPLRLPASGRAEMRDRVAAMRDRGHVVAFQLWTRSGTLLFSHPQLGPQATRELRTEVVGNQDVVEPDDRHGAVQADNVVVPLGGDRAPDPGVAVVLMPEDRLDALRSQMQTRLGAAVAAVVALFVLILAASRRRMLRDQRAARIDALTGLGNRTSLAEVGRRQGHPRTLVLLDLDGFKDVNDTLGHAAGDELLVQVAGTLRSAVRPGDHVVRLGGDEFAVFVEGVGDHAAAVRIAGHVHEALNSAGLTAHGVELDVRASFGVTVDPTGTAGIGDMLRQADVAMYRAKDSATMPVVLYRSEDDQHDTDRLALLGELRRAIGNEELVLHYQPVVRPAPHDAAEVATAGGTGPSQPVQVASVEALVRWQHPHRGLLAPGAFVPAAEHTGLIHPLTGYVLDQAVAQTASWRRAGLDLVVAVNISPRAITQALVAHVLTVLDRHAVPARQLKLEITETALADDPDETITVLRELRAAGVQISLDDFGAGYTSLAYLTALPLTELKIDRSFVASLGADREKNAVVAAVIELGHRLGLSIVAEGVETTATRDHLLRLGCDAQQGYLYSKPVRPDQLEGWLANTGTPAAVG